MPKLSKSIDGINRMTIRVAIRLTESDYDTLKQYARKTKSKVRDIIEDAAISGVEEKVINALDEITKGE